MFGNSPFPSRQTSGIVLGFLGVPVEPVFVVGCVQLPPERGLQKQIKILIVLEGGVQPDHEIRVAQSEDLWGNFITKSESHRARICGGNFSVDVF